MRSDGCSRALPVPDLAPRAQGFRRAIGGAREVFAGNRLRNGLVTAWHDIGGPSGAVTPGDGSGLMEPGTADAVMLSLYLAPRRQFLCPTPC